MFLTEVKQGCARGSYLFFFLSAPHQRVSCVSRWAIAGTSLLIEHLSDSSLITDFRRRQNNQLDNTFCLQMVVWDNGFSKMFCSVFLLLSISWFNKCRHVAVETWYCGLLKCNFGTVPLTSALVGFTSHLSIRVLGRTTLPLVHSGPVSAHQQIQLGVLNKSWTYWCSSLGHTSPLTKPINGQWGVLISLTTAECPAYVIHWVIETFPIKTLIGAVCFIVNLLVILWLINIS